MIGIYLAAFKALHPKYNIIYQDINGKRDIGGDMLNIDLSLFDFIIATPPCNYWSRARGNKISLYSLQTKHLLPEILKKLENQDKPFIVENVCNIKRFKEENILLNRNCNIYIINRHVYFTNIILDINGIKQRQDFINHGYVIQYDDMLNKDHQGGFNVFNVIERFLQTVHHENITYNYSEIEQLKLVI